MHIQGSQAGSFVGVQRHALAPCRRHSVVETSHALTATAAPRSCGGSSRLFWRSNAVSSDGNAVEADLRSRLGNSFGNAVVTDEAVPEGHKGLHGFLYGEGGAEEHDSSTNYRFRKGEDDGTMLLPVPEYLEARDGEKPVGVYALYDEDRNLQYVGIARNVVMAVKGHLASVGEERCALVRTMVFANRAMATKSNLEREASHWLAEAGTLPPGNGVERELWEAKGPVAAIMSDKERAEYEEKLLKLRKAMGENLADAVEGEAPDSAQRRLDMIRAVEGDDWSAVIDGQTRATVPGGGAVGSGEASTSAPGAGAGTAPQQPIVSPFSRANVHRSIGGEAGAGEAAPRAMTVETVDAALNEVRPYLQADGGDVEVAGVQDGVVLLRLQGACGTCPSSTATMKMGIERSLRAAFGEQLKEVMQVDAVDTSASAAAVDEHLNLLRPAIQGYGGSVEVVSVEEGVVVVRYTGPPPIKMGISAAIKDKFPDVRDVQYAE